MLDVILLFCGAIYALIMLVRVLTLKPNFISRLFHTVDKTNTNHGGQLVADVLKAHGVPYIFTLCGGHISPILVACEKLDIRVVDTRHEVTAVFAADAVARLSGRIGVAAVTAGPGLTNTITAVKNAQMAESPVLLLGGAAATLLRDRGALQDIDQMSLLKPLCKFTASIRQVRDIIPILKNAIHIATSGTPGPVFVELPIDTLYPYELVHRMAIGEMATGKHLSLFQRGLNWYISRYVDSMFAGGFAPADVTPIPPTWRRATEDQMDKAAVLLSRAKRPVCLFGSQVLTPPTPSADVSTALHRLKIPTFLGGMSRGLLGANSPYQVRHERRTVLKDADLVIMLGGVADFRLNYGRSLPKNVPIIAVNRDESQLRLNVNTFWTASLLVQADSADFLCRLANKLSDYEPDADWLTQVRQSDEAKEKKNDAAAAAEASGGLNPLDVLQRTSLSIGDNVILVADGGDFVGSAAYILRPPSPLSWLDPGAYGTLGVGAGFAIGAKLVHPEKEVWVIFGDGAFGYSLSEFDTLSRHKLGITALIGNDACWTQIAREQKTMFKSLVSCNLARTAYHESAAALGAKGFIVKDISDLEDAIAGSKAANKSGQPAVINVHIGTSNFRDGSISL